MGFEKNLMIGNDSIALLKPASPDSAVGYIFEMIICARCTQYYDWFYHDENVTLMPLTGALLVDAEGDVRRVDKEQFVDIPAGAGYRVRSLERSPVRVLAIASSEAVFSGWNEVAESVKRHASVGWDGHIRYS